MAEIAFLGLTRTSRARKLFVQLLTDIPGRVRSQRISTPALQETAA